MHSEPLSRTFVGRADELRRLDGYLAEAIEGRGGICFVTGDPGSGKSSILDEFTRRTGQAHPEVVFASGDCNPQTGTGDAYLPFREIMTELTATGDEGLGSDTGSAPSWLAAASRILAEHGPDLIDLFVPGAALVTRVGTQAAGRLRERRKAAAGDAVSSPGGPDQTHLMEQYTNVIQALSERHPLALVVDDLHWSDEASISLMFHLSRRIARHRVLLIGAYRPNEVAAGRDSGRHPLESPLNELKRYHGDISIDLQATQEVSGRTFVDELLDAEPNDLGPDFRDTLFAHTGGHALFSVELLHHLKDRGHIQRNAAGQWETTAGLSWEGLPARVEGVISERVARLEPAEHSLLTAASVLGEAFPAEILAELQNTVTRDVLRSLSGPLSRRHALVTARGVERMGDTRLSTYEFRHNLIHQYFYESLDPVEKSMLHEDAARAIEALMEEPGGAFVVQLARHYDRAGMPADAARWYLRAGSEAQRAFANAEARSHLERCLALLDGLAGTQHDPAGVRGAQADAARELGDVLLREGDYQAARENYQQAMDRDDSPVPEVRADLAARIATTHVRENHYDRAHDLFDQAEKCLGEKPRSPGPKLDAWMNLQVQRLWLYYWQGDIQGMARVVAEAEPDIERHGNHAHRRRFYTGKASLGNRRDRFLPSDDTLAASATALAAALASNSLADQADGQFGAGFSHLLAGELASAEELMESALQGSTRCGNRTLQARCLAYLCVLRRRQRRPGEVRALAADALEISQSLGMREYAGVIGGCQSWLALEEGDFETARNLATQALDCWREHAPRYPFKWLALLPLMDLDRNHADGPGPAIEHARELMDPANARLPEALEAALREAIAAHESGRIEAAKTALDGALKAACEGGYL